MDIPSLVVDSDNNIYVVARELDTTFTAPDANDLWFAYYNGTTWSETNVSDHLRAAGARMAKTDSMNTTLISTSRLPWSGPDKTRPTMS